MCVGRCVGVCVRESEKESVCACVLFLVFLLVDGQQRGRCGSVPSSSGLIDYPE